METNIKKICVINLKLSAEEACWLKSYVQNSFVDDEDLKSKEMRRKIFESLPDFKELYNLESN